MRKFLVFFIILNIVISTYLNAEFGPWETTLVRKEKKVVKEERIVTSTPGWVFIRMIRFFQIVISPQDGLNCRYQPTCSQYGLICIRDYGPFIGLIMSADRYMRCNPFGAWGKDLPSENYFWNTSNTNSGD